jgi:cyclase
MLRTRIVPVLLLENNYLVKTVKFSNPKYIGDPINAVRIFNEKTVDELMLIDIRASSLGSNINFELITRIAAECNMPLCYCGGIQTADQVDFLISLGIEKVGISSAGLLNPTLVSESTKRVGSQSIMGVIDVKYDSSVQSYSVYIKNGTLKLDLSLNEAINLFTDNGVGEICINSIDNDGMCEGYDLRLIKNHFTNLDIPITVVGGAGSFYHMTDVLNIVRSAAVAAGSLFVFKGKFKAVLIQYPDQNTKDEFFSKFYL